MRKLAITFAAAALAVSASATAQETLTAAVPVAEEVAATEAEAQSGLIVLGAAEVSLDEYQWLARPIVVFADRLVA